MRITTRRVTFTVSVQPGLHTPRLRRARREVIFLRAGAALEGVHHHIKRVYILLHPISQYSGGGEEGAASLTNGDRASLDGGSLLFNRFETVC